MSRRPRQYKVEMLDPKIAGWFELKGAGTFEEYMEVADAVESAVVFDPSIGAYTVDPIRLPVAVRQHIRIVIPLGV